MLELVDTHCHIHFPDYALDPEQTIVNASQAGVTRLICVGCTLIDSELAVKFAAEHSNIWASIGLHPHEAGIYVNDHKSLQIFRELAKQRKVIAIGEIGLDYHYMHSSKIDQKKLLRFQLDVAKEHNLPLIFHVREAYQDFWKIFDEYKDLRGVIHSFSAGPQELDQILTRGLHVGLNGIMTFTKNQQQLEAAKMIPKDRLLLETDAPFLTPAPERGKMCEPRHVRLVAEYLADLRGEDLLKLAKNSTKNAKALFNLT